MKIIGFVSVFIIIFSYLVYLDSNKTIYDNWSIVKADTKGEDNSFFDEDITTVKIQASNNSDEEFLVAYDSKGKGVYCLELEYPENVYVCTPMLLEKNNIGEEEYLVDVIKLSESKKGFLTRVTYYNFAYVKKLKIEMAPLEFECLTDDSCEFKSADNYIAFNYNILKRLKIMNDYEIN